MKTQSPITFHCRQDGIPLQVSLYEENRGACFALNDPDNDQSRQVLLTYADTLKLARALSAFLDSKITH
jgi:hypothetical protein